MGKEGRCTGFKCRAVSTCLYGVVASTFLEHVGLMMGSVRHGQVAIVFFCFQFLLNRRHGKKETPFLMSGVRQCLCVCVCSFSVVTSVVVVFQ